MTARRPRRRWRRLGSVRLLGWLGWPVWLLWWPVRLWLLCRLRRPLRLGWLGWPVWLLWWPVRLWLLCRLRRPLRLGWWPVRLPRGPGWLRVSRPRPGNRRRRVPRRWCCSRAVRWWRGRRLLRGWRCWGIRLDRKS